MARGDQLLRQWKMLKMLQTRGEGIPLARLAAELSVDERTVQRDIVVFDEIGIPIDYHEDEYGKRFWKLPVDFFSKGEIVLSHTEALALLLAEQMFEPIAGTHLAEGLESLMDKLRSSVPEKARQYFADVDTLTYIPKFGWTDHKPHAHTIRGLIEAAQKELTVSIGYNAVWNASEGNTLFDPYGLVLFDGNLFALGFSHRSQAVRILKVIRISSLEITKKSFKPLQVDVRQHFEHSFGIVQGSGEPIKIVVKFTGKAAQLVSERIWHESQELRWLPAEPTLFEAVKNEPDALLATFRLAETGVFKGWIKGFGEHAVVLEPQQLRREIHEELLAAARRYE
ncbi:MAG TPA: WYL domain-containing protein [Phycisphaerae bacterium]|nr:WYL domain-containing protein [Phycisphaerae bacterium]HOM50245.1 WYL domain-containing protein [Phycisphaerae bacterium]HOQ85396.1 WYL domain-containing protein [Phycisphaerae bacterium]HPP27550.1 WYL domain-containing protein [Phycisphaerae bacterium]HPU25205.1 WYL domain-containing protein [Phycisphaerae bacterium]